MNTDSQVPSKDSHFWMNTDSQVPSKDSYFWMNTDSRMTSKDSYFWVNTDSLSKIQKIHSNDTENTMKLSSIILIWVETDHSRFFTNKLRAIKTRQNTTFPQFGRGRISEINSALYVSEFRATSCLDNMTPKWDCRFETLNCVYSHCRKWDCFTGNPIL